MVTGDARPDRLFPYSSRTRWQSLPQQTFELQVDLGESYRLRLELDSWGSPQKTRIKREVVSCNERPVFEFVNGEVHLFNNDYQHEGMYPFDWFRSALATVQPRPENTLSMNFKNWIETLHCWELNPRSLSKLTEREEIEPASDMSNFASYYRHVSQERQGSASRLRGALSQIVEGFESLDLVLAGANST